jgi:hypothetical protein
VHRVRESLKAKGERSKAKADKAGWFVLLVQLVSLVQFVELVRRAGGREENREKG